jgi:undecaprenyl-diphosphatase
LAAAYGGAAVIAYAVKVAVGRGRHRNVGLFASAAHLGYPSGHATLAAAVYGTAGLLLARRVRTPTRRAAAAACFALAVVVGFSRLYLGRHYLSDVIAGTALGGLWAVALTRTNPRRRGNRRAATSGPER